MRRALTCLWFVTRPSWGGLERRKKGDPKEENSVLWCIENFLNGTNTFFVQKFILESLIIHHSFSLGKQLWSLKKFAILLEINVKWQFIQGVNNYLLSNIQCMFRHFWDLQQKILMQHSDMENVWTLGSRIPFF